MYDPQSTSPGSIMPRYQWLTNNVLDTSDTQDKMEAMVTLGVPYQKTEYTMRLEDLEAQALQIEENLHQDPTFVENYERRKKRLCRRQRICSYTQKRNCCINRLFTTFRN